MSKFLSHAKALEQKGMFPFIYKHEQDFVLVSYSSCILCKFLYTYVCKNRVFRNFIEIEISPELSYMILSDAEK